MHSEARNPKNSTQIDPAPESSSSSKNNRLVKSCCRNPGPSKTCYPSSTWEQKITIFHFLAFVKEFCPGVYTPGQNSFTNFSLLESFFDIAPFWDDAESSSSSKKSLGFSVEPPNLHMAANSAYIMVWEPLRNHVGFFRVPLKTCYPSSVWEPKSTKIKMLQKRRTFIGQLYRLPMNVLRIWPVLMIFQFFYDFGPFHNQALARRISMNFEVGNSYVFQPPAPPENLGRLSIMSSAAGISLSARQAADSRGGRGAEVCMTNRLRRFVN